MVSTHPKKYAWIQRRVIRQATWVKQTDYRTRGALPLHSTRECQRVVRCSLGKTVTTFHGIEKIPNLQPQREELALTGTGRTRPAPKCDRWRPNKGGLEDEFLNLDMAWPLNVGSTLMLGFFAIFRCFNLTHVTGTGPFCSAG